MGKPLLDKKYQWFLTGRPPASPDGLIALALEANKRGVTYGQLVGGTTEFERFQIVEAYRRKRKKDASRRKKRTAP